MLQGRVCLRVVFNQSDPKTSQIWVFISYSNSWQEAVMGKIPKTLSHSELRGAGIALSFHLGFDVGSDAQQTR